MLGLLQLLGGVAYAIVGAFILIPVTSAHPVAYVISPFYLLIGILFLVIGILEMVFGAALLSGRNWARILAIIGGVIDLFAIPVGTIIGIIIIFYLTRPRVAAYFK